MVEITTENAKTCGVISIFANVTIHNKTQSVYTWMRQAKQSINKQGLYLDPLLGSYIPDRYLNYLKPILWLLHFTQDVDALANLRENIYYSRYALYQQDLIVNKFYLDSIKNNPKEFVYSLEHTPYGIMLDDLVDYEKV